MKEHRCAPLPVCGEQGDPFLLGMSDWASGGDTEPDGVTESKEKNPFRAMGGLGLGPEAPL